ncbi:hypothetical protein HOG48_05490 [Candidatus Peregrinibacteria bacterium]|nr:hypothetical protein [Candidatus Peregrinibacteria bacterium]
MGDLELFDVLEAAPKNVRVAADKVIDTQVLTEVQVFDVMNALRGAILDGRVDNLSTEELLGEAELDDILDDEEREQLVLEALDEDGIPEGVREPLLVFAKAYAGFRFKNELIEARAHIEQGMEDAELDLALEDDEDEDDWYEG